MTPAFDIVDHPSAAIWAPKSQFSYTTLDITVCPRFVSLDGCQGLPRYTDPFSFILLVNLEFWIKNPYTLSFNVLGAATYPFGDIPSLFTDFISQLSKTAWAPPKIKSTSPQMKQLW